MEQSSLRRRLTPPQVAKLLGVEPQTVRTWITSGELRAINVAQRHCVRPRFRIDPVDLAEFERGREVTFAPATPRKKKMAGNVMDLLV